ncbi:hypothetical protein ACFWIB_15185 [Streptomyces sp. NPDC127051]|uniref:hypothetical protein n=1 Tax=Streptomyces sp. NPDC127051 TaxID=3347119 RepID=UPI0036676154
MANDIEINVRVANNSGAGLSATTQSLNRLKASARDANTQMTRLRAEMSRDVTLRARLDNQTEAAFTQLRTTVKEMKADGPITIKARLDNDTAEAFATLKSTIRDLKAGGPITIKARLDNSSASAFMTLKSTVRELRSERPITIKARLDNNTAAAFTTLKATIAELKGTGTVRLRIGLANDTRAGLAAVKAGLRELKAMSPVRLEARFSGDAGQITAAARAVGQLRTDAGRAATALSALTPRAVAAAAALELVQHAASEASDELRELRTRAAAAGAALHELRTGGTSASTSLRSVSRSSESAAGRMEGLTTRSETLRERMNELGPALGRVSNNMGGLRGSLGSMSSSADRASNSSNKLLQIALTLAPALVPLASAVAPAAASMGAAGAAAAVFTAALIPQFKAISDANKAEDKYSKALGEHGAASGQAAKAEGKYLDAVSAMPQITREAGAALDRMKASYQAWSDSLASDTLPVAMKGFAVLGGLFPKLTPLVQGASQQLSRFMAILGGGVQSPGFDKMMQRFAVFATDSLAKGISGLVRFGQAMEAGGSSRNGIASFMESARANGPAVGETLKNLGEAIGRILVASANTGLGILTLVNSFARLINAIPPEVLSRLVELAVAFKAVSLASSGIALVAPRLAAAGAAASAFTRSAQFGGVSAAIQGVTASLTAMQRTTIVLAIIAAAVIAINELAAKAKGAPPSVDGLTDSLKRLGEAGKFTGELKRTFGDMDQFVKQAQQMRYANEALEKTKPYMSLIPMYPLVEKLAPKIDEMINGTKSLSSMAERFKAFDDSFATLARSGHADEAAKQFKRFEDALRASGMTADQVAKIFPQYLAAVSSLKAEQELAARSMGLFGEQAVAVKEKLDAQKASADGLRQAIQALNETNRNTLDGMIGFEAAIDAAAESAKKNADSLHTTHGALDLNSEKARAAAQSLSDLAAKTDEAAAAARESGGSWDYVNGVYERGREKLVEAAVQMGLTSREAAALSAQILSTPDKTAVLRGNMEDLQAKLNAARAQLATVPDSRRAEVRATIADLEAKVNRAQADLNSLGDRTVYIRTIYQKFTEAHPGGQANAHGGVIGAAAGGPRSRMTLVGEQGPELVDLAPGSRVRSNSDSRRIAEGFASSGGGGTPVLELRSSGSRIDDFLIEILRRSIRDKGGNVQQVLGNGRGSS